MTTPTPIGSAPDDGSFRPAASIPSAQTVKPAGLLSVPVKHDPAYPHFGLVNGPVDHKQHQNQQRGLDRYVEVINFDTGERCFKNLYENGKGLHFKHTGYSPMYLDDFTAAGIVYPFQVDLTGEPR